MRLPLLLRLLLWLPTPCCSCHCLDPSRELQIIHTDFKPENVMLIEPLKDRVWELPTPGSTLPAPKGQGKGTAAAAGGTAATGGDGGAAGAAAGALTKGQKKALRKKAKKAAAKAVAATGGTAGDGDGEDGDGDDSGGEGGESTAGVTPANGSVVDLVGAAGSAGASGEAGAAGGAGAEQGEGAGAAAAAEQRGGDGEEEEEQQAAAAEGLLRLSINDAAAAAANNGNCNDAPPSTAATPADAATPANTATAADAASPSQPAPDSAAPKVIVQPGLTPEQLPSAKCKLVDFGNACWTHKQFTTDIQTRQYRSPEVILGAKYSTPCDIWSLACMVFEMVTGESLGRAGGGLEWVGRGRGRRGVEGFMGSWGRCWGRAVGREGMGRA